MRPTENYSNVICEQCHNELRSYSNFRKDLVFKQVSLIQFVDGIDDQQQLETSSNSDHNIKNEPCSSTFMHIKTESYNKEQDNEDYTNFVSTEYLLPYSLQDEVEDPEQLEEYDQFCTIDIERRYIKKQSSSKSQSSGDMKPKKFYKRALCGQVVII